MASSINKAIVLGNVTHDPDTRTVGSGQTCCSFSVATNRQFESNGVRKEEASFHSIVAWGRLGELCAKYLYKGKQIYVEGRMHNKEWTNTEGEKRSKVEIVAENIVFLDKLAKKQEDSTESDVFAGEFTDLLK